MEKVTFKELIKDTLLCYEVNWNIGREAEDQLKFFYRDGMVGPHYNSKGFVQAEIGVTNALKNTVILFRVRHDTYEQAQAHLVRDLMTAGMFKGYSDIIQRNLHDDRREFEGQVVAANTFPLPLISVSKAQYAEYQQLRKEKEVKIPCCPFCKDEDIEELGENAYNGMAEYECQACTSRWTRPYES